MALVITSAPSTELLTVEEAKRHLRVYSSDLDDEVASLIRAARDYCERFAQRTLRDTTTRTYKTDAWWSGVLYLEFPPIIGITSITYYDADNASQTLASSNYALRNTTNGSGELEWTAAASLPVLYDRLDAITVTYTAGYTALDGATPLPPVALQAMKTKLTELWGAGTEAEMDAAKKCTDRLLSLVDWTGYA